MSLPTLVTGANAAFVAATLKAPCALDLPADALAAIGRGVADYVAGDHAPGISDGRSKEAVPAGWVGAVEHVGEGGFFTVLLADPETGESLRGKADLWELRRAPAPVYDPLALEAEVVAVPDAPGRWVRRTAGLYGQVRETPMDVFEGADGLRAGTRDAWGGPGVFVRGYSSPVRDMAGEWFKAEEAA